MANGPELPNVHGAITHTDMTEEHKIIKTQNTIRNIENSYRLGPGLRGCGAAIAERTRCNTKHIDMTEQKKIIKTQDTIRNIEGSYRLGPGRGLRGCTDDQNRDMVAAF